MTESKDLSRADWLILAFVTAGVFLCRYYVLSSDPLLAWPITDSIAHPGRYSSGDILVQAGVSGNFLLYRLLAYLPLLSENYPLRDFIIYVPIYIVTLYSWWKVFAELGAGRKEIYLSILLLVFSDDKLSLNWSHVLPAYLISSSSVQFLQVLGFLFYLKNRLYIALGLTAVSGYFHPATALSFGAVYVAIICYDALRKRSWPALGPILLFCVIFLPNALMIAFNSQGSFTVTVAYFDAFKRYQPQAYVGDHFRMGYAYTLALLALVYRFHSALNAGLSRKRELFLFIAISIAGSVAWLVNLYFFKNLQVIHTYFLMRMFSIIHPLLVMLVVTTSTFLYTSSKTVTERAIVALFVLTPLIYFSPPIALIIVVSCAVLVAGKPWWPVVFITLLVVYFGSVVAQHQSSCTALLDYVRNTGKGRVGNEFNWFQAGVLFASVPFIFWTSVKRVQSTATITRGRSLLIIIVCAVALVFFRTAYFRLKESNYKISAMFNFKPNDYWGVRPSDRSFAELLDWVCQSPYKLFCVPPYDDRFLSFRYLSGKGVYIFHRDIAQLMYSPDFYLRGIHRLEEVGGTSPSLPKAFMNGEVTRSNGMYEKNWQNLIANSNFNAVIFEKNRMTITGNQYTLPVFQNEKYIVFRTIKQKNI